MVAISRAATAPHDQGTGDALCLKVVVKAGRDVYMETLSDTNVRAVSELIDCDRTVIRQTRNLEEHRGVLTHTE
jgi:hypothetical protein